MKEIMSVDRAITIARIFLAGDEENHPEITSMDRQEAYDVLAAWHEPIANFQRSIPTGPIPSNPRRPPIRNMVYR